MVAGDAWWQGTAFADWQGLRPCNGTPACLEAAVGSSGFLGECIPFSPNALRELWEQRSGQGGGPYANGTNHTLQLMEGGGSFCACNPGYYRSGEDCGTFEFSPWLLALLMLAATPIWIVWQNIALILNLKRAQLFQRNIATRTFQALTLALGIWSLCPLSSLLMSVAGLDQMLIVFIICVNIATSIMVVCMLLIVLTWNNAVQNAQQATDKGNATSACDVNVATAFSGAYLLLATVGLIMGKQDLVYLLAVMMWWIVVCIYVFKGRAFAKILLEAQEIPGKGTTSGNEKKAQNLDRDATSRLTVAVSRIQLCIRRTLIVLLIFTGSILLEIVAQRKPREHPGDKNLQVGAAILLMSSSLSVRGHDAGRVDGKAGMVAGDAWWQGTAFADWQGLMPCNETTACPDAAVGSSGLLGGCIPFSTNALRELWEQRSGQTGEGGGPYADGTNHTLQLIERGGSFCACNPGHFRLGEDCGTFKFSPWLLVWLMLAAAPIWMVWQNVALLINLKRGRQLESNAATRTFAALTLALGIWDVCPISLLLVSVAGFDQMLFVLAIGVNIASSIMVVCMLLIVITWNKAVQIGIRRGRGNAHARFKATSAYQEKVMVCFSGAYLLLATVWLFMGKVDLVYLLSVVLWWIVICIYGFKGREFARMLQDAQNSPGNGTFSGNENKAENVISRLTFAVSRIHMCIRRALIVLLIFTGSIVLEVFAQRKPRESIDDTSLQSASATLLMASAIGLFLVLFRYLRPPLEQKLRHNGKGSQSRPVGAKSTSVTPSSTL
ncbi:unnamed protein product [Durusdinium trenchii]|uniref:Uncharacterized protein n=1 Tax=Durusdinium trenchii TaxID=1381693 RepID=A0ABP0H6R3_9DINO